VRNKQGACRIEIVSIYLARDRNTRLSFLCGKRIKGTDRTRALKENAVHKRVLGLLVCMLFVPCVLRARAQSPSQSPSAATLGVTSRGVLRGTVTDPSGALVQRAEVVLHSADTGIPNQTTVSGADGRYSFAGVAPGRYTVRVNDPGFAAFESKPVKVIEERAQALDVRLQLETQKFQVDVSSESADDTDPNRNGTAVVLKGSDLDSLPTDPSMLSQELDAMAGSDSPAIYVDGFSNGTLPPKNMIREIRINQNPFSARNDTGPGGGMIEIFTKPGTDKLHGDFYFFGDDSAFNTQNPFTQGQPAYHSTTMNGDVNGPLRKNASYVLSFNRNSSQTNAVVNALVLDPTLQNQVSFTQALPSPNTSTGFTPRIDLQFGTKSTVVLRYSYNDNEQTNGGIGQLNLPSQGFNSSTVSQMFQASNSQIINKNIVDDIRFQYIRTRSSQTPMSTAPTVAVQGAFTGGGNNGGASHDNHDSYELQNYFSIQAGKHYLSPGVRLRVNRDANASLSGYNGEYTFASLSAYQTTEQGIALGMTPAEIAANGGGPLQFSLTTGTPAAIVDVVDVGAFFQDDWKIRKNFTLSYGLRYEIQNYIKDKGDFGPRIGFAWSLGAKKDKPAPYVIRGGSGIFYTRIPSSDIMQAQRQNGILQQQYFVASPTTFPNVPDPSTLGPASSPTTYQISSNFRTQYSIIDTLELDHPLGTRGSLYVQGYSNRVVHLLVPRNINAPLPGTYNPAVPTSGTRPYGGTQNIDEFESDGLARSDSITVGANFRAKNGFGFYSYYMYRIRSSDANGGFPSDEYDLGADYGRGIQDERHTLFFDLISPTLPGRVNIVAFCQASSGPPFNITVAQDLNGDSQFNDRPAFATDLTRPSVIATQFGTFDTSPIPGQRIIPIDYGQAPSLFDLNAELYRSFTFGPALPVPPAPSGAANAAAPAPKGKPYVARKYNLTFIVEAVNAINHVNLASPVGVLGSPLFGQSIGLADGGGANANRVITLILAGRF
jgi:hypothetical protein